ncbi:MAG: ATP-grasp domain-containing protein [Gemmatimonadota bacterium]
MQLKRILVTDGEQRAALAVVRSLGRAGYDVRVCSTRRTCLASTSRYCRQHAQVGNALAEPETFAAALKRLCEDWQIDVLVPITEPSALALLSWRGIARVALPSAESFRAVADKRNLLEAASSVGFAVPEQTIVETPEQARDLVPSGLGFPVVLKPARSVGGTGREQVKLTVLHAANWSQLQQRLKGLPAGAFPVLIQQRIKGPGTGIFLLRWNGLIRAVFAHRRLREKPPSGGVSVYCESIAADPMLVELAARLLDRFDWQGVAMVELKIDSRTGRPYVMEVNGRFWGSLQLAIDAGVDFPRLLLECMGGRMPARMPRYLPGVRSRWWWGDVDQLLARMRRSRAALDLGEDSGGRLEAVREFLALWRPGDRSDVFRFSDPLPLVRESVDWVARR